MYCLPCSPHNLMVYIRLVRFICKQHQVNSAAHSEQCNSEQFYGRLNEAVWSWNFQQLLCGNCRTWTRLKTAHLYNVQATESGNMQVFTRFNPNISNFFMGAVPTSRQISILQMVSFRKVSTFIMGGTVSMETKCLWLIFRVHKTQIIPWLDTKM